MERTENLRKDRPWHVSGAAIDFMRVASELVGSFDDNAGFERGQIAGVTLPRSTNFLLAHGNAACKNNGRPHSLLFRYTHMEEDQKWVA